mmetsp:Transcript_12583/g.20976  ORF Transcript_12583/g.20976 Transcript_12583/m.20976 type:complete len:190 (+) Transcript_12583:75-644(+)|eukprot:CAMPEP_0119006548 /NCGR_PEP_ID=MMETSP1176-20130426/2356_1 /TAXON_ID=265551 /ORGANISM="Synedropsis recta cf, Strain CCMP1620" /LENGTH=189 /DNA_ID=CAMNT_0006958469 /DNA_START=23 /DNA_END=592 /DNA_ORIENTATION=-
MTLASTEFANEGDNALFQAIKQQQWNTTVKLLLETHPELAKETDKYGNLPLHTAIGFRCPDDGLLLTLLSLNPDACKVHGTDYWLPLHIAAMWGVSSTVLKALILAYPQGLDDCGDPGIKGRSPRHFSSRFPHNKEALEQSTEEWIRIKEAEEEECNREAQMDRKRNYDRARMRQRGGDEQAQNSTTDK